MKNNFILQHNWCNFCVNFYINFNLDTYIEFAEDVYCDEKLVYKKGDLIKHIEPIKVGRRCYGLLVLGKPFSKKLTIDLLETCYEIESYFVYNYKLLWEVLNLMNKNS